MYTKGEWEFSIKDNWPTVHTINDVIARINPHPQEYKANAHLIAAAPRMYEAIKRALEDHRDGLTTLKVSTHAQLLKALAKAETPVKIKEVR